MQDRENERIRLIERIRAQKAEIAQLIQDTEYWNDNNPESPIDVGVEGLYRMNSELDEMLRNLS